MVFKLGHRHTFACLATGAGIGTFFCDSNSTASFWGGIVKTLRCATRVTTEPTRVQHFHTTRVSWQSVPASFPCRVPLRSRRPLRRVNSESPLVIAHQPHRVFFGSIRLKCSPCFNLFASTSATSVRYSTWYCVTPFSQTSTKYGTTANAAFVIVAWCRNVSNRSRR